MHFTTHGRVFLWKCQSIWDRECPDLRGTRTPNLRIHAECSNHLRYIMDIHWIKINYCCPRYLAKIFSTFLYLHQIPAIKNISLFSKCVLSTTKWPWFCSDQSVDQDVVLISKDLTEYLGHSTHLYWIRHQWASYQIRKITGCACAGNAGNVFPATDFKGNR